MLQKWNRRLEKAMPFITPSSVVLGVLLYSWFHSLEFIVSWLFAFMTFSGSLSLNFKEIKQTVKQPLPLLISMGILHVGMPLFALVVGKIIFGDDIYTVTGLVLSFSIPTGIASLMWVTIYRGNIAFTLALILIDTLLSPFILPSTILFLFHTKIDFNATAIMMKMLWMVVLPSLLGITLNQLTKGKVKQIWGPQLSPFSKISLALVMVINSSVIAPELRHITLHLTTILLVTGFIASLGYLFGFVVGKWMGWDYESCTALTFNCGMRNNSAGVVIAIANFPGPVAIPVIVMTLFQQLLASISGMLIVRYQSKENRMKEKTVEGCVSEM